MDTNNTKIKYVVGAVVILLIVGVSVLVWQKMSTNNEKKLVPLSDEVKRELLKNIPNTPPLSDAEKKEILSRVGTTTLLSDEQRQELIK